MTGILALEDGTVFEGRSFGASGESLGEMVFNTSLSGYQEVLTDPSYCGQIVAMTYPLIGNYGVTPEDEESGGPQVAGFVVKECSRVVSNWRATMSLPEYLKKHDVVGLEGIDTRRLTKHIRQAGAMRSVISTVDLDPRSLVDKAKKSPGLVNADLARVVTCGAEYAWSQAGARRVVVLDYGVKRNILRELARRDCEVVVMPASATAAQVLERKPHGVMLSNGPGDPAAVTYAIDTVRGLLGRVPIFGICLGHQILGLAYGGTTYKLKFGHRGGNQPVKDLRTGKVDITSQNHGFCVDPDSLPAGEVELTHINLNDRTVEGLAHKKLPVFSVQYHPEANPGPHDASHLFDRFMDLIEENKK